MILLLDRVENIVGKGENAGSHNVFKRFPRGLLKSGLCGKELMQGN